MNTHSRRTRAFTLIELLVVIAIIGIISAIVISSLDSARDKARIGAGKALATQIDLAEGDYAVGEWNFDECSGTTAGDASGNGNTGTLVNSPTWTTDTPAGTGCSLSFNGSYVSVPIGNMAPNGSDFTVSFWIKGTGVGDVIQNTSGGNAGTFTAGFALVLPSGWGCPTTGEMYFNMGNGSSHDAGFCSKSLLTDGKWHQFTLVVQRLVNVIMYVDGTEDSRGSTSLSGSVAPLFFRIGGPGNWQNNYGGEMDSVHFFLKSFTAMDVSRMYAKEAPKYLVAQK